MAKEIELKLTLSPADARKLPAHPILADQSPRQRQLLNTYYDTADLRLKKRRVALRFRQIGEEWLLTVKSAEPASGGLATRSEWEYPATPGVFDFAPVDDPALRVELEAVAASLVPIFDTNFHRSAWTITQGRSRIEVALDRGQISTQGREAPLCELELELLEGEVAELFALTRQLQENVSLHPAVASKAERGYALFANEPSQPFKARPPRLSAAMTPVEAFRRIAFSCLEQLQRNEAGIIRGENPEFVHQARVALRRLRSAIFLFGPVLPQDFTKPYKEAWRNLASTLGTARNWDVFVEETLAPVLNLFPEDRTLGQLDRQGRRKARLARAEVATYLSSPAYSRLLVDFTAALTVLSDVSDEKLADFAIRRLHRHAQKVRRLVRNHQALEAGGWHQLRIAFKKLRYPVEFFAPFLSAHRLKPYFATLTRLQNDLGLINDLVTAQGLIQEMRESRAPGLMEGWIAGRQALLLLCLPDRLDEWLAQKTPWKNP